MKAVNTHNKSFDHAIRVLAQTLADYQEALEKFEEGGSQLVVEYTNKAGKTNTIKNPLYQAIETLRSDILAYSKELGLTPAGLKKLNDELGKPKEKSLLAQVLSEAP